MREECIALGLVPHPTPILRQTSAINRLRIQKHKHEISYVHKKGGERSISNE